MQTDSASGSNPHRGEGNIEATLVEVGSGSDVTVTVRLLDAGDQKMKNGLGLIIWTDNSNDYELFVHIRYSEISIDEE